MTYAPSSPWQVGPSMPLFSSSPSVSLICARIRHSNKFSSFPSQFYPFGFVHCRHHSPALQTRHRISTHHISTATMPCIPKTATLSSSPSSLNAFFDTFNTYLQLDVAPTTSLSTTQNVMFSQSTQPEFLPNVQFQRGIENWMLQSSLLNTVEKLEVIAETPLMLNSNLLLSDALLPTGGKTDRPPTKEEIELLQKAFATFYSSNPSVRNVPQAVELLGKCLTVWQDTKQSGDEIAGLLRVRGDAYMEMRQPLDAEKDYAKAIEYLDGPDGNKADPEERPASRLGRARAVRSLGSSATRTQALQAANDYEVYFNYISRIDADDEDDQEQENALSKSSFPPRAVLDGIQRNPYASWEWGMVERVAGNYDRASEIHQLASNAFEEIGDKPRAVICRLDRGLDLAAGLNEDSGRKGVSGDVAKVKEILETAIRATVNTEGRDVELLQRVVAKEGEARVALSGVLWESKDKAAAESQFGEACGRLDELNADYQAREKERIKKGRMPPPQMQRLGFSIDDIVGADEASCSRFKNEKFVEDKLVWSASLQSKVNKFLNLSR